MVGVEVDVIGVIKVDVYFRMIVDYIYVVGDVINWVNLMLVVICEGVVFVVMVFNDMLMVYDYFDIVLAVFIQLLVGFVGMIEEEV